MSKGTKVRTVRIEDGLWEEAKAATQANGETISDIIRQALTQYIKESETK